MNQNGFTPRNNVPGYSYGQPNTVPQNGYPGTGAVPQGGTMNQSGFGAQGTDAPTFSFTAPQAGNGYVGGMAGGFSPVPPAAGSAGYNPVPPAPATGGYSPVPPAPATGGYNPVPPAPSTGGFNPVPPMSASTGYSPVPPAGANAAYSYRPQPAQSSPAGSFIPKTPYSPGYTNPGYQQGYQKPAANGYPQGYSAYSQMGRNIPQNTAPQQKPSQVPLNGGGYIPQPVKVRKRPPETSDVVLYAVGGVLVLLFILGMFVPVNGFQWLKWLFLIPAVLSTALLWVKPITDDNKRLCYTIVAGALCIAMIISLIASAGKNTGDPKNSTAAQQNGTQQDAAGNIGSIMTGNNSSGQGSTAGGGSQAGSGSDGYGSSNYQEGSQTEGQQGSAAVTNAAAKERLAQVFISWSMNDLDQMVELCLPSWRVKQENPKKELFQLLQNRTPIGNVDLVNDPAQNGDSLNFILQVTISRNNGKDPILSQMTVRMVIENGIWYVDPNSLKSNEIQETPDPNATPAITPKPTPYVDGNTVLYYNPDGGKLYHLDANCVSVHSKYTPLKGTFTYSQINDAQYAGLEPCNVCAAPLRNQ